MNDTNNVPDTIACKVVERGDSGDISPDRVTALAIADNQPIAISAEMKYDACTVLLHRLKGVEGQSNGDTVTPCKLENPADMILMLMGHDDTG